MKQVFRLTLLFFTVAFFWLAACAPKPTEVPPKATFPLAPSAPAATRNVLPTQPALPTPTPVEALITQAVYQRAADLCARAAEQLVSGMSTEGKTAEAPLLSMYASESGNWEPAGINRTHRLTEASRPDQVRSLACISSRSYSVGVYSDGSIAEVTNWTVYLLNWEDGSLLEKQDFSGGTPPAVKTGYGGGGGASPSMPYFDWLLERFSAGSMVFRYGPVSSLAFSPDGKYLAALTTSGTLKVWELPSMRVVFTPDDEHWKLLDLQALQFSPVHSLLAVAGKGGLRLVSVPEGEIQADVQGMADDTGDDFYDIDFSADGSRLVAGGHHFYRIYAVPGMEVIDEAQLERMQITRVHFSEDEVNIIAYARGTALKSGVYIWRLADKSEVFFQRKDEPDAWVPLPGSDLLAMASEDSSAIWLYTMAPSRQNVNAQGMRVSSAVLYGFREGSGVMRLCVDTQGKHLAAFNDENHIIIWDLQTKTALNIRSGGADPISALQFSPDGSTLAVGFKSGIIELWPVLP